MLPEAAQRVAAAGVQRCSSYAGSTPLPCDKRLCLLLPAQLQQSRHAPCTCIPHQHLPYTTPLCLVQHHSALYNTTVPCTTPLCLVQHHSAKRSSHSCLQHAAPSDHHQGHSYGTGQLSACCPLPHRCRGARASGQALHHHGLPNQRPSRPRATWLAHALHTPLQRPTSRRRASTPHATRRPVSRPQGPRWLGRPGRGLPTRPRPGGALLGPPQQAYASRPGTRLPGWCARGTARAHGRKL
jgi:hypothetical protein